MRYDDMACKETANWCRPLHTGSAYDKLIERRDTNMTNDGAAQQGTPVVETPDPY